MKRSKFSLSHHKLLTCNMGALVPVGCFEVLPGDSIQQASSLLVRLSPMLAPMMHQVVVRVHHWFVPNRLIWDNWEDFITGGPDGDDATVAPTITIVGGGPEIGTLHDYLGVPTDVAGGLSVSALPFRAYALIYNEWYRDQDLINELAISKGDGNDNTTVTLLQNVSWEKDYFTSARPWPQKGDAVDISLTGNAPITATGQFVTRDLGGAAPDRPMRAETGTGDYATTAIPASNIAQQYWSGLETDLSGVSAVTVRELREAFALQRFAEARARFGSRYTEYLRYLGVRSSDARLQRPEYLGGGKQNIQISEVLQTGVTTDGDDTEGVGNLKGHGIGTMRSNRYRRFFEEHGIVLSLLSVRPKSMYVQGLQRLWTRATREDYFQKELQHIGQQEVLNKELYANDSDPDQVFGYQDRYDEYRRSENWVCGEFRSTLSYWHMARIFGANVTLNEAFIKCVPTMEPFADQVAHPLQIMCHHSIQARRILSRSASPSIF